MVPQHYLLGGGGEQPVPGHTNTLANSTDISGEETPRPDGHERPSVCCLEGVTGPTAVGPVSSQEMVMASLPSLWPLKSASARVA